MGEFGTGFATGFFNKLSEGIDTRNADARDYFNKQVETARTLGLENRRRSSAMIDESVGIAKRLQSMGVPKDIILSQANMDPAGLGDFYTQVEKLKLEANVPVDEAFFRSVYKLSGTFKAPDEDFNTFFSKIYGPIVQAAQEDPEGFKDDPEGSIWARAFGVGAMDRARDRLATTEVVPGMTAEQAIAQGDTPRPNKVGGDSFVNVDAEALRKVTTSDEALTPANMEIISGQFVEQTDLMSTELTSAKDDQGNSAFDLSNPASVKQLEIASKQAGYQKLKEQYAGEEKYLKYVRQRYNLDEEGWPIGMGEPDTAPTGGATEPPPTEVVEGGSKVDDPVEGPTRPVTERLSEDAQGFKDQYSTPTSIQIPNKEGSTTTLMYVRKEPNGMVTYKDTNTGEEVTDYPEEFAKRAE